MLMKLEKSNEAFFCVKFSVFCILLSWLFSKFYLFVSNKLKYSDKLEEKLSYLHSNEDSPELVGEGMRSIDFS